MDDSSHLLEVQQSQGSLLNLVEEEHVFASLTTAPTSSSTFQTKQTEAGAGLEDFLREDLCHFGKSAFFIL